MQIDAVQVDSVVTIHYTLTVEGQVVDRSQEEPLSYLHGHGNLVPGLEETLTGKAAGARFEVSVPPEKAYGERDPEGIQQVGRDQFPADLDLQPGTTLRGELGNGEPVVLRVTEIDGDQITVDLNHPLAGCTLEFAIEVVSIRAATQEELNHGHAHGPGGHAH